MPETNTKDAPDLKTDSDSNSKWSKEIINIIIGIILGILCLIYSIYLFKKEDEYGNNKVKGTIINSLCTEHKTRKNRIKWDCSLNIQYNIDNIQYSNNNFKSDNSRKKYIDGDSIDLRYNPNDKTKITDNTFTNKTLAIILIIASIFIIVIPIVWYFLVTKNKTLATVSSSLTVAGAGAGVGVGTISTAGIGAIGKVINR
jgi:flagellar basal body-associated protein FliL